MPLYFTFAIGLLCYSSVASSRIVVSLYALALDASQLRGRCRPRQVERARIGLTQTLGAGGNGCVLIFATT